MSAGNFGVENGLQRADDLVGQTRHFLGRDGGRLFRGGRGGVGRVGLASSVLRRRHVKKSCAFTSACARQSISSRVLYIANEARQVAVTPNRANSGMTQWVPARTATPERSMIVATSCGCAPFISNETIGPLSLVVAEDAQRIDLAQPVMGVVHERRLRGRGCAPCRPRRHSRSRRRARSPARSAACRPRICAAARHR